MRWGKTTWRWVEYQQRTSPSPEKVKQPDLEFSLYGHMYPFLGCASIFNCHCSVKYNGCVTECVVHNFGYSAMIIIWYRIYNLNSHQHCVIPENIHTPPTERIGNSGGGGGVVLAGFKRPKMLVNAWNLTGISREVGGLKKNSFHGGGMNNYWYHTLSETKKVEG